MQLSWSGSNLQPVPTLPEPHFCLRVTLASGAWIPPGPWGRVGGEPGDASKGFAELKSPPSTQSASRCLASGFSLTSEGAWRTWRVQPVSDPRWDWPEGGGGGASYVHAVEEPLPPSSHACPRREDAAGCCRVCAPRMRAEHKATGPEVSNETVRLEKDLDGQAGHLGPLWPPTSCVRTFAPAAPSV